MKYWQCLAMLDMDELPILAKHAEDLGFEGVTLSQHLVTFSEQYEEYAYSDDSQIRWYPETHWPDPWVQIAALCQVTTRLKFLNTVYVLPLHDPFNAAKVISTTENLCPDRLCLGAGIGWQKSEFNLVGQDFHTRGRRTDEMLEVMQLLWTGEPVQFHGEFYDFPELQMSPGLKSRLPVIIGGFSETALKRAARHDGWVGGQHEMDEVTSLVGALKQYRSDLGRSMDDFDIVLALYQVNDETLGRCRELGVTRLYRDAFRGEDGKASCMSLDEKLRDMDAFANQYLV